jgi:hypothetical protein
MLGIRLLTEFLQRLENETPEPAPIPNHPLLGRATLENRDSIHGHRQLRIAFTVFLGSYIRYMYEYQCENELW